MVPSGTNKVENLLARARAGDNQAIERLFERCRGYLAVVARAQVETWLRSKVDASDIVQQTLLEAHRGFRQFSGSSEAEWLGWLRRILSRNASDFVRHYKGAEKRRVGREIPINAPNDADFGPHVHEPADAIETPSELLMRRERELELTEAISRLSPDHREVIMLRNLQRLPFEEVARQLGRTRPATQMLWMRAIEKLQQMLNPDDSPD